MNICELFEKGYEIMATAPYKENLYDCLEMYFRSHNYISCFIVPYKRSEGQEDAFAALFLSEEEI